MKVGGASQGPPANQRRPELRNNQIQNLSERWGVATHSLCIWWQWLRTLNCTVVMSISDLISESNHMTHRQHHESTPIQLSDAYFETGHFPIHIFTGWNISIKYVFFFNWGIIFYLINLHRNSNGNSNEQVGSKKNRIKESTLSRMKHLVRRCNSCYSLRTIWAVHHCVYIQMLLNLICLCLQSLIKHCVHWLATLLDTLNDYVRCYSSWITLYAVQCNGESGAYTGNTGRGGNGSWIGH